MKEIYNLLMQNTYEFSAKCISVCAMRFSSERKLMICFNIFRNAQYVTLIMKCTLRWAQIWIVERTFFAIFFRFFWEFLRIACFAATKIHIWPNFDLYFVFKNLSPSSSQQKNILPNNTVHITVFIN